MFDIIVPTCKIESEISCLLSNLRHAEPGRRVIATCCDDSAAANRNAGLDAATAEFVVMVDDDVTGFETGFATALVETLRSCPDYAMVSARLLSPQGGYGFMCGGMDNATASVSVARERCLPTACVAMRNDGLRFDENFIGSGFEDNDICRQIAAANPRAVFAVNNEVLVTHANEMKNQKGEFWQHNESYFRRKWGAA